MDSQSSIDCKHTLSLSSFCKINNWTSITAGSSTCVMLSDIYHYCSWSSIVDSQLSDLTYHPCCECWATCAAGGYPAPSGRIKFSEILYDAKIVKENVKTALSIVYWPSGPNPSFALGEQITKEC